MDTARLPEARLLWPEMAEAEAQARRDLSRVVWSGTAPTESNPLIAQGVDALTRYIDAQAAMLAHLYVSEEIARTSGVTR